VSSLLLNRADQLTKHLADTIILCAFPPVTFVDLFVTDDCNLRCPYCFVHGKRPKYLDIETARAAVDFLIRESRDDQDVTILFIGGEPLLNMPVIEFVVEQGRKAAREAGKRMHFNITTNGTLLNEDILRFFRQNQIPFLLSIDGGKETQDRYRRYADGGGSFDTIASIMPLIKKYNPWVGVRMTPTPETVALLYDNVRSLHELGANQYIIGIATGIPWTDAELAVYESELNRVADWYVRMKKRGADIRINQFGEGNKERLGNMRFMWGCGAGRGRISVATDGEIQGCAKVQGLNSLSGLKSFGNVHTGWGDLAARYAFLSTMLMLRKDCFGCDLVTDCAGGCPAVNWESTGSIYQSDCVQCKATKVGTMAKAKVIAKLSKNGKRDYRP